MSGKTQPTTRSRLLLALACIAVLARCAPSKSAPAAETPRQETARVRAERPVRIEPASARAALGDARAARLLARNLDPRVSLPETLLANRIAAWRSLPVGERVARWASLFAGRDDNTYCFGPRAGCYTADSLLVQDFKLDCVSLFYRCTELARAQSPADAVFLALGTRFAGGDPDRVVTATGAVSYDDPSHLDYSEDFAATGLWGRDVTRDVGDAVADGAGTSRYPGGSRWFLPRERAATARLRDGDLLLFVLDEHNEKARRLRDQYGLLVGHQALVAVDGRSVLQIHAAQAALSGIYDGNRVVRVPLATYLQRVERFKGIMVVRMESGAVPDDVEDTAPERR